MSHEPMAPAPSMTMAPVSHQPSGLQPSPAPSANHQQELQAKILSLFNSGVGSSVAPSSGGSAVVPQSQGYGSSMGGQPSGSHSGAGMAKMSPTSSPVMGVRPQPRAQPSVPPANYGPPPPAGRMGAPLQSAPRPPLSTGTGINFDNPSVQKALDTLIQSGPSINHLVNSGSVPPPSAPRPGQGMSPGMGPGMGGQGVPMSHYGRHY